MTRARAAEASFERLVAEHERRLGQFLIQIVGSRALAEDLLQETFLSAFREDLDAVENVRAWLYAVARNRALNALRTRRRRQSALQRVIERFGAEAAADPADAVAVRDFLERCLPVEDRIILVLRHVHGFEGPELAQILDISPDAARQRLVRARRRLIEALDAAAETSARTEPGLRPLPAGGWPRTEAAGAPAPTEVRLAQDFLSPLARLDHGARPHLIVAPAGSRARAARRRLSSVVRRR